MSSTLFQYHKVHSRLLFLLSSLLTSLSDSENPDSQHPLCIYLFDELQYTCKAVSELLTHTPGEPNLPARVQCLCTLCGPFLTLEELWFYTEYQRIIVNFVRRNNNLVIIYENVLILKGYLLRYVEIERCVAFSIKYFIKENRRNGMG